MSTKRKASTCVLAAVLQLSAVGSVFAHGVNIIGENVCDADTSMVSYTVTSWSASAPGGENPSVLVYVAGYLAGEGLFADPNYSFSGLVAAPNGESVAIAALADGDWGDGASGGQTSHATVLLDADCSPPIGEGRFTGGGHQIRIDGVRVTRGLTLHCDLLLSNNLEINWGGNSFHMTEHLTTVECSDDPLIIQAPPAAPLDTMVGVGTGRYNGMDGYTIEFTLVDHGEPGTGNDEAALLVYETANPANVVLDVPLQTLSGGNLQAHYDQPHK